MSNILFWSLGLEIVGPGGGAEGPSLLSVNAPACGWLRFNVVRDANGEGGYVSVVLTWNPVAQSVHLYE